MTAKSKITFYNIMNRPATKPPRKAPSKATERKIILEAEGRCPWCEEWRKLKAAEMEIHHIDGDRSNSVPENLILTCKNHHGQIESQVIPAWEVTLKKQILCNPGTLERLGLKKQEPVLKLVAKKRAKQSVVGGNNSGIAAETIHNTGIMAGTIKIPKSTKRPIHVIGSTVTSVDHYGYIEYLVKRLSKYRSWRPGGGGPPDNPGAVRNIFERDFGRLPKDLALERFDDAVSYFLDKIENTTLGRMGKAKVSTFEEWKQKGKQRI